MERISFRQWRLRSGLAVAVLLGATSCATVPQSPSGQAEQPLRQRLLAAAQALGSDRAREAALALEAEQTGTYFAVEQARSPAQGIGEARRRFKWSFDPKRQRLMREADQTFPGGIRFSYRSAATSQGGWNVDLLKWRNGTDLATFGADEALRSRLQSERFFPHLLLNQALAATGLESAGAGFRYLDAAGELIEVTLDQASLRPAAAVQLVDGKPQVTLVYSDYGRRHGVMMPNRLQLFQAGRLQEDLRLGKTRIASIEEARLAPPTAYRPAPAGGEPGAREIAPGVLFFENMAANYHSLAIDMGDHLILVEAPLNAAYSGQQKAILASLKPGKAVRYVLVTHHHGDHTGGLASWAEAGVTILVPRGARVAIERQLQARGFAGKAAIEEIDDRRSFGAGASRADAYAFDSSHSEAHLLVHLPGSGILFQGDLFYLPERGDIPVAFPVVDDLQRQIERLNLGVEQIVGVHGRPGSMQDLRESLRRRTAAGS